MADISLDELLALEEQVWQALARGDQDADRELLASNFLGVYPSGFANREDHASQLDAGPSVSSYEIEKPMLLLLGPSHVGLTYLASFARPGHADPMRMYVTSIWAEVDGNWTNIFSQDTPADPR